MKLHPYSKEMRRLLLLIAAATLAIGILFLLSAASIPYGIMAPFVLSAAVFFSFLPLVLFIRLRRSWTRLLGESSFDLAPACIPRKAGFVYVAKGFAWRPLHLQRFQELIQQGVEPAQTVKDSMVGDPMVHGVGQAEEQSLFLPEPLLNNHMVILGATGTGKTRFSETLIDQDIGRGDAVVIIDPKGDAGLLDRVYDSCRRHGRGDDFRMISIPHPYSGSSRMNPLAHYSEPKEVADRIAATLSGDPRSEPFRAFAWDFTKVIATALDTMNEPINVETLEKYAFHDTWALVYRMFRKFCPGLRISEDLKETLDSYRNYCATQKKQFPAIDALINMASMDRGHFHSIAGNLRTILSKLTSPNTAYLLCPETNPGPEGLGLSGDAEVLSWKRIDNDRLVVYFFLGSLLGADSAKAVSKMVLTALSSHLGMKYAYEDPRTFNEKRLSVFIDESHDAISEGFINVINKGRGAGFSLTLAAQGLADFETALGSPAAARRMLSNVGTLISFRAAHPEDAAMISDKAGDRLLLSVTRNQRYEPALFGSGRTNIGDFAYSDARSISTREGKLVPSFMLDRLGRFHFIGIWSGEIWKGIVPVLHPPEHRIAVTLRHVPEGAGAFTRAPAHVPAPDGEVAAP